MSFLLFINFLFLISPWPYFMCIYLHYRSYINSGTSRWNSPQQTFFACTFCFPNTYHVMILRRFDPLSCSLKRAYLCLHALFLMNKTKDEISWVSSHDLYWENKMYKRKRSILSPVDLSKHLITAWIIQNFIQLVNLWTFSVFFSFSAIDRVWLNLYSRALSGNGQLPFIKTFVREFIQCRTFLRVLYLVRNARSAFCTWVRILYPVRNAYSAFYTQSVFYSQSVVRSP